MSLYARLAALIAIGLLIAAAWWKVEHTLDAREKRGYDRAKAEDQAAMQAQADRNHELQRAAEKRYTVQAGVRERVIVETIVEVRHASQNLATCPVPERARSLLNDAARCAREDSAASCGPDEPLPVAR